MKTYSGLVIDLDDTLVDTRILKPLREARRWREAVDRVMETITYTEIVDTLGHLEESGVPWAVVTTSVSFYAQRVLAFHGFEPTCLVAFHDAPPKPRPEGVTKAIECIGRNRQEVVGVGDSEVDIAAYHAAGIPAYAAGWSSAVAAGPWDGTLPEPRHLRALLPGE